MLIYVCIAIPKRVLYAIKIIIFRTLFKSLVYSGFCLDRFNCILRSVNENLPKRELLIL